MQEIRRAQISSLGHNKHLATNLQPMKKDPKFLPKIHIKCLEVLEVSIESGLHTSKPLVYYSHISERSFLRNKGGLKRSICFKLTP